MFEFGIVERTPELIAGEINQIKEEVQGAVINGTIEIGRRLCEVKAMVPVGSWGDWLRDNVRYSERTAQNAMAIFNEYGKKGVPAGLMNASITNALQLIGLPEDIKHELIDSGAAEEMSSRELKERIRELERERDEAQLRIEDLAGALSAEEDAAEEAERKTDEALRKLEDVCSHRDQMIRSMEYVCSHRDQLIRSMEAQREINQELAKDIKEARSEAEEQRAIALDAVRKTAEAVEKQRELELELELRKRQEQAAPIQMEPAVIERDSPETLRELAELRARAKQTESADAAIFREGLSRMIEEFNRCMDLLKSIERFDGDSRANQLREQLRTTINGFRLA